MKVNVYITQISGERFWRVDEPIPPQIQVAINVNILGIERRSDETAEAPFIFSVNFNPSIAHITIRGAGRISGNKGEIGKLLEGHKEGRPPPIEVVQAVSGAAMAEAIVVSKTIGIPPPLPPLTPPKQKIKDVSKMRYTS